MRESNTGAGADLDEVAPIGRAYGSSGDPAPETPDAQGESAAAAPMLHQAAAATLDRERIAGPRHADDQARPSRRADARSRGERLIHSASAVMAIAIIAVIAVMVMRVRAADAAERGRVQASSAVVPEASAIFSYDYRHLSKSFAAASSGLAPEMRSDYNKTTQTAVAPVAKQYRAVVSASVAAVAVISATPTKVVTLVFVNQVSSSDRVSGSRLDLIRVRITLVHEHGKWLVSRADAL